MVEGQYSQALEEHNLIIDYIHINSTYTKLGIQLQQEEAQGRKNLKQLNNSIMNMESQLNVSYRALN